MILLYFFVANQDSRILSSKFLHSMSNQEHLESALREQGLMLTDHEVRFVISENVEDFRLYWDSLLPLIESQLRRIGAPKFENLAEESKNNIARAVGAITANIPMLCFTEVPEGRDLSQHYRNFGGYGVVVKQKWLHENNGDRVLYLGNYSPTTQRLFQITAHLILSNMIKSPDESIIFDTQSFKSILGLFTYIEMRNHQEEFEWRVVGQHGIFGQKRNTGQRIPLLLNQIEQILVDKDGDLNYFEKVVDEILNDSEVKTRPKIVIRKPSLTSP